MTPKANSQIVKLQGGREYLTVAGRVQAFRETNPLGVISTELISTEPRIIVRATVHNEDGVVIASGHGTAPLAGRGIGKARYHTGRSPRAGGALRHRTACHISSIAHMGYED